MLGSNVAEPLARITIDDLVGSDSFLLSQVGVFGRLASASCLYLKLGICDSADCFSRVRNVVVPGGPNGCIMQFTIDSGPANAYSARKSRYLKRCFGGATYQKPV